MNPCCCSLPPACCRQCPNNNPYGFSEFYPDRRSVYQPVAPVWPGRIEGEDMEDWFKRFIEANKPK
jgi:hypothetical protein